MAYKYKEVIKEELEYTDLDNADSQVEMLKELDEAYRKAKSFDELVNFYPQKDEIPSDEFFMMMGYIIKGYKDELKEVHSKAKAFDEIFNAVNAPYVEYPEDWMVDVLKVVRNFEREANDET